MLYRGLESRSAERSWSLRNRNNGWRIPGQRTDSKLSTCPNALRLVVHNEERNTLSCHWLPNGVQGSMQCGVPGSRGRHGKVVTWQLAVAPCAILRAHSKKQAPPLEKKGYSNHVPKYPSCAAGHTAMCHAVRAEQRKLKFRGGTIPGIFRASSCDLYPASPIQRRHRAREHCASLGAERSVIGVCACGTLKSSTA